MRCTADCQQAFYGKALTPLSDSVCMTNSNGTLQVIQVRYLVTMRDMCYYSSISQRKIEPTFGQLLLCSTAAGVLGGAFGNPSDVVNVRMQNDGQLPLSQRRNYKNAIDGLIRICREEGPQVLFRGLGYSTTRAVVMTVSQMTSYDVFKDLFGDKLGYGNGLVTHFAASVSAVSLVNLSINPHVLIAMYVGIGRYNNVFTAGCHQDTNHECSQCRIPTSHHFDHSYGHYGRNWFILQGVVTCLYSTWTPHHCHLSCHGAT